ncbi:MAG TPA: hypothetical protein VKU19_16435 [Bryobacteraceae bacterium]|nr:hypothetical protein [Bryobacteraceae bacterium]
MQYYVTAQAEETEEKPQAEYTVIFRRTITIPAEVEVTVEVDEGSTREQIIEAAVDVGYAQCQPQWTSKYGEDLRDVIRGATGSPLEEEAKIVLDADGSEVPQTRRKKTTK